VTDHTTNTHSYNHSI